MFREVSNKINLAELEKEILAFWQKNRIFEKELEKRKNNPPYVFYEGPPTANGRPGIHHVMARTIKDAVCRYKAMKGHYVARKAGWDTHGLPVEIAVEKELGLTQKNQIEEYGIDKFNKACRELVNKHIDMDEGWRQLTDRMGYWIDLDHPYITYKNDYIESIWWAIKTIYNKGLIYKGFKIVPQSPTIETPLSSHELSLGYKEVKDPNCFIKVKIEESPRDSLEGARMVVWTTTPWTLISNVAMAVGTDIDYVLIENKRTVKSGDDKIDLTDKLVLARERLSVIDGEYEILDSFKGKDLVGSVYGQIFDFLPIDREKYPNGLTVVAGDFVSTEDGSGIVHMAPAFGQDDYEMSRVYNLPFLQPVTPGGRFTDGVGEFSGRTVKTFTYPDHTEEGVDKDVIYALKKMDKLYKSSFDYVHSYPHCWRTENPIIYYARESWFIKSPEYKKDMVENNDQINWCPPEIGSGRFGNWLAEVKEWSLSRDRYWGTPLPIWVAENGEDHFAVGSIDELKEGLFEKEDGSRVPVSSLPEEEIDLHRPFVDRVIYEKEGTIYRRTPEIIDVWFDSGAMPFAQFHYPFENKEVFEKNFPADFIAEGVDQTRGWFYTLHNIATVLFGKPAFKNIIVNDLILDKHGQKMSKSRGNVVFHNEIMERFGADSLRWYFLAASPPWIPKKFDEEGVAEVQRKFVNTLMNTYSFFVLYANVDKFDPRQEAVAHGKRPEIDRWILSKLYSLVKTVNGHMDKYDLTKSVRAISDFVLDDVSNWYVRRNRRRFWKSEAGEDKMAAYQTLYEVLLTITKMIAPVAPFVSEEIFRNLNRDQSLESVHHADYPVVTKEMEARIDVDLEEKMAFAQRVVSLARALRNEAQIRVRQPLSELVVNSNQKTHREYAAQMQGIICEEINVKQLRFAEKSGEMVTFSAKPNFKQLGARAGKLMGLLAGKIKGLGEDDILAYMKNNALTLDANGQTFELGEDDIEVVAEAKEGFLVQRDAGLTVALNTELNDELLTEGFAREFVNRVQNLRKEAGFEVTDRIKIGVEGADDTTSSKLKQQERYICTETLAEELKFVTLDASFKKRVQLDSTELIVGLEKL